MAPLVPISSKHAGERRCPGSRMVGFAAPGSRLESGLGPRPRRKISWGKGLA